MKRHLAALGTLALAACSTTGEAPGTPGANPRLRVAQLEAARSAGGGELAALLDHPDLAVRVSAVEALGRVPLESGEPGVTEALCAALDDPAPDVLLAAYFALGLRADPSSAAALLPRRSEGDETVRAAWVECASRVPDAALHEELLFSLGDAAARVRREVVTAPHRWTGDDSVGSEADSLLASVLRGAARGDGERDVEVIWRALFSLGRRATEERREQLGAHRGLLEGFVSSPHDLVRLYAVRALARLDPAETTRAVLERATLDRDWRVVVEAVVGLGRAADSRSVTALSSAAAHESAHVRRVAFEALARFAVPYAELQHTLLRGRADESLAVQAATFAVEVELLGPGARNRALELAQAPEATLRAGVAAAMDGLGVEYGLPLLRGLAADEQPLVAVNALGAIGRLAAAAREAQRPDGGATDILRRAILDADPGRAVAALAALDELITVNELPLLERAYFGAKGDVAEDLKTSCLDAAAKLGGPAVVALCTRSLEDPLPRVRAAGRAHLVELGVEPPTLEQLVEPGPTPPPLVARSKGLRSSAVIRTTRGTLTFVLFDDETPRHVENFVRLAQEGHYDGLNFHRVVPDFVAQGGCHRGDGNGSITWYSSAGGGLPHELTPRKYVRGTLGMPRSTPLDSGGSQLFVTHRPTPHLDGRYTVFGQLEGGFDVLDRIEQGDVIVEVQVTRAGGL